MKTLLTDLNQAHGTHELVEGQVLSLMKAANYCMKDYSFNTNRRVVKRPNEGGKSADYDSSYSVCY
ncbi:hypothetical protein GN958_ATG13373 [Phytophthora infestans]|uniref:Uncharacterized protein n=1 Tax=Phytophthora infestans TaxID=4787 RepID=A0A8S9UEP3_PHYIN|nr:hypothetical protein GN958_ATG13373 [Phytophthora infestans]